VNILDRILAAKRDEVTILHRPQTASLLRERALAAERPRPFADRLRDPDGRLAVIAELKRRSPSKGVLAADLDPAAWAAAYEAGGAAALSVLTDGPFFGGSVQDLARARAAVGLPVLRKDFVIDAVQVYETRAIGADALLLILAALGDDALVADLLALGAELGLGVLVEAHTPSEVERALRLGATIVGVNARDLTTFREDLDGVVQAAAAIPPEVVAVAESAVRAPDDARRLADAGYDAVLVGEALVRSDDPAGLVSRLRVGPVDGRRRRGA
jgi:indole-3-glycerol phosphate synthase